MHFLTGGTQANLTVIAAALRPHQGVLCSEAGHIAVHEAGAVEATGHKVLGLSAPDGKITAQQVKQAYVDHINDESYDQIVKPGLVYISQSTELGTTYSKAELEEMYRVCKECGLYLYVDGARLAYALGAEGMDVDFEVLAANCDVFYIGGTKVGALFGEAVVILNDALKTDFRYIMRQEGGLVAKGRLLGIQFSELLRDGFYIETGRRADRLADEIRKACEDPGVSLPGAQQYQPDIPGDPGRRAGELEGQICLRVPVPRGREPQRRALLHQLGHQAGGRESPGRRHSQQLKRTDTWIC